MKKADVEKKMTAIKEAVEKRYPSVTADIKLNEWKKAVIIAFTSTSIARPM